MSPLRRRQRHQQRQEARQRSQIQHPPARSDVAGVTEEDLRALLDYAQQTVSDPSKEALFDMPPTLRAKLDSVIAELTGQGQ